MITNELKIKGIVWDLDGTLTLPGDLSFVDLRRKYQIPKYSDITQFINDPTFNPQRRIECIKEIEALETIAREKMQLQPYCKEILEYSEHLGLKLALLTRNSRSAVNTLVDRMGINNPFDIVITRDDDLKIKNKPSPEPIFHIAKSWNLDPKELVVIGDFIHDIQTGSNAGSRTVLLLNDKNRQYSSLATKTISCLLDLCPILDSWLHISSEKQS